MGRIVGIDLGTTNSLVAYLDPQTKTPKCIEGPHGSSLCPSIVSLDPDGNGIVGEAARRRLLTQPERPIYSVKRLMMDGQSVEPCGPSIHFGVFVCGSRYAARLLVVPRSIPTMRPMSVSRDRRTVAGKIFTTHYAASSFSTLATRLRM